MYRIDSEYLDIKTYSETTKICTNLLLGVSLGCDKIAVSYLEGRSIADNNQYLFHVVKEGSTFTFDPDLFDYLGAVTTNKEVQDISNKKTLNVPVRYHVFYEILSH